MLLTRLGFTLYFGELSHLQAYQWDVAKAFYIGWKYDTIVTSYLIIPLYIILNLIVPIKNVGLFNFYQFLQKIIFFSYALIIPLILFSDLGFYSFFQDHINILFFGLIEDDTTALVKSIWENYPVHYALIAYGTYAIFILWLNRKLFPRVEKRKSNLRSSSGKYLGMLSVSLVLLFGGLRGGYGDLVLAPKYSDFSESEFVNQLALNGVIALEKTIQLRRESNGTDFDMTKAMGYGSNIHKAFSDFIGLDVAPTDRTQLINLIKRKTPTNPKLDEHKLNVVVLLMESFGGHWGKYNSSDFDFLGSLKKHFDEDFYFKNIISSENGTIGSLMTMATNIPSRPGKRFLSESKYMQMPLSSASHIPYFNKGYETSFIYGGKLGWRNIGRYFKYQNYHNIIGENAITKSLNLSGIQGTEWGLYDEHFFDFIFDKLKESSRPKFILGLSTSNHPPFLVPKTFSQKELKIPETLESRIAREEKLFLERFKAFQYSNAMLAKFIQRVKDSKLSENTIIAVTGDHNFWGFMNYGKAETYSKYSVPLYFFIPKSIPIETFDPLKIGSHEDIMRTLYNVSLSESEYLSFGEDLFSNEESFALNSSIFAGEEGVVYKGKGYNWAQLPLIESKTTDDDFKRLNKRYKSTMAISDFYLETLYQSKK
ncbi:MAG: phosphoglycerol transferase MdoB-like AlkP superfamily enzyme [Bacteriovoracaceae bacterium]|jgi:phosphoglycerol transferase MdoB-like AlkP superfamily enzyme